LEEQALCLVGRDIYEKLIKVYTEKQWGRPCNELPAFIIRRLPVRYAFDNNYFTDKFQGVPIGGYNVLIDKLLECIDVKLNCDFFGEYKYEWTKMANELIYTGALDEYFGYQYGRLDWRTIELKHTTLPISNYQGNAVVNYTSYEKPFTRIIEHKHFEYFGGDVYKIDKTVISEEYSTEYKEGGERFYPVNDKKNEELANKYRLFAQSQYRVHFGGRLGEYRYYDMDKTIERAFELYNKLNYNGKRNEL
jgi:UDP-galactopyranose mutase